MTTTVGPSVSKAPEDPLGALLDKYVELPRAEQVGNGVPVDFEYIESPTKQNLLVRRLQKLLGRYGYALQDVEYKVVHDVNDKYDEVYKLTFHGWHQYKQKT